MAVKKLYYKNVLYSIDVSKISEEEFCVQVNDKKNILNVLKHLGKNFFFINGKAYKVEILENSSKKISLYVENFKKIFTFEKNEKNMIIPALLADKSLDESGFGYSFCEHLKSPISGRVIKINCKKSDFVKKGQTLVVIESMKMENDIKVPHDSFIKNVQIKPKDLVKTIQVLITLKMKGDVDGNFSKSENEEKKISNR